MASLIENLIEELNQEYAIYEELLVVSREKTSAIVSNNLDRLRETTDKEQLYVDVLTGLENKRRSTMGNIATVINKSKADIKITDIISFLDGQTEFQEPLMIINEKLARIARQLYEVNGLILFRISAEHLKQQNIQRICSKKADIREPEQRNNRANLTKPSKRK